jgi:oligopeptide/dipeptide ABC transporter ATP-binding protein
VSVGSPAAPLLEVDDLVVRYPIARGISGAITRRPKLAAHAVEGVSFSVAPGELLALVGESGCGKTTTAQTAMRLVEPVSGTIRFKGQDITKLPQRQMRPLRRRMQIIYQDPYDSLDPRFRVRDAVEEALIVHDLGTRDERRDRTVRALERAGLAPADLFLERFPHVADEPVSMLDVSVRAGILSLLDELRETGVGILMITHDLSTAARYADRIAVMYLGRVVEQGPARAVVGNPQHPYTKALISVVPKRDPRDRSEPQILQGETPNAVLIPSGCRFHPRCPIAEDRCKTEDPVLHPPGAAAAPGHEAACLLV